MGSSAEAVLTPSARVVSHFFENGEKCEKPRTQAHPAFQNHELDREKKRMNSVLEKILKAFTNPRNSDLLHNPLRNAFRRRRRSRS